MSTTDFYRAFEDRYRGPRALIFERLKVYLPFIAPLRTLYQPSTAIDLGCGRGEWLELLQQQGFEPHGVDLDTHMLAACRERGLSTTQGDAIAHLESLPENSLCIVSGFHIAEHITFDDLETLTLQALRVLKPGGLLILETPNPENLSVGSCNFYLDPTHQRPIPPRLLSFLVEHSGFARAKTVRLQESPELHERSDIRLLDVLSGVSPDYAIVAQKGAPREVLASFDPGFAAHYGLELGQLAERYDNQAFQRSSALGERIAQAEASVSALGPIATLSERLQEEAPELARRRAEAENLRSRLSELEENLEHWKTHASALTAERDALRRSLSWRLTAPVRYMAEQLKHPIQMLRNAVNFTIRTGLNALQRPLSRLMVIVMRDPKRSHRINNWLLTSFPALHTQLRDIGRIQGIVPDRPPEEASAALGSPSPRMRKIYTDLYLAIERHKTKKIHENRD